MTALCLIPPTPAFKEGSLYECEPMLTNWESG